MASDKVNYPEASAIAQAIKHQIRTGGFWEAMPGYAKESLDQIATAMARTVAGDGVHWDGIVGYAHAAKPTDNVVEPAALKSDRSLDYPYSVPRASYPPTAAQRAGMEAIERSMREIPNRE